MKFSTRLSIAVHILLCLDVLGDRRKFTSNVLAGSIGVNPVVVREITLLDILNAVEDDVSVFRMHEHPSPECPIGRNVHAVLGAELDAAEQAMLDRLASTTLANLADATRERISRQEQA